jgi:hypothetical protein
MENRWVLVHQKKIGVFATYQFPSNLKKKANTSSELVKSQATVDLVPHKVELRWGRI